MVLETRNVEWLNLNGQRTYPLAEGTSSYDVSNTLKLPNDFIVDLNWSINTNNTIDVRDFYVYSVATFSTGVVIGFGYDGNKIASASISALTFTDNKSYNIIGSGIFSDSKGIVTIGSLFSVMDSLHGEARFDMDGAALVPTLIKQTLIDVTGLFVRSSAGISNRYQGDVVLKAGADVVLDTAVNGDVTEITINAIPGEGFQPPGSGLDENGNDLNPVLTINGIPPDSSGNFSFLGDVCVNFSGTEGVITMDNDCSTPCCDCDDLAIINDELAIVRNTIDYINLESGRLAAEIQAVSVNLVTSKLEGPPTEVSRMVAIMKALLDNADLSADCAPACPTVIQGEPFTLNDDETFELNNDDILEI